MSLPSFPDRQNIPTREEVVNQVLSSIAMEELGLSHIINAEGEKLQYALGTIPGVTGPEQPPTINELLELNSSVLKTLDSTMMNQFFLKEKMVNALSANVLTGPTGPTGPPGPFLSSYLEAHGSGQAVAAGQNIAFSAATVDSVGSGITMDPTGTVFTIANPGLYQVEWSINLAPGSVTTTDAVVGLMENGNPTVGSSSSATGNFSSGALINVGATAYTLSLHNYNEQITIQSPAGMESTAASIRILRFADGPSTTP